MDVTFVENKPYFAESYFKERVTRLHKIDDGILIKFWPVLFLTLLLLRLFLITPLIKLFLIIFLIPILFLLRESK